MNRKEEYLQILSELENEPESIAFTIARAKSRAKRTALVRRIFTVPASSIAAFFIIFVIMVNTSVTFASACGRIPLIKELAAVVSFSPSLSAAVENEYVQPIELEQSFNDIKMRVEYVIVDQKQLNIFYTLSSDKYSNLHTDSEITAADGAPFESFALHSRHYNAKNEELRQLTADFLYADMPDSLMLICKIYSNELNKDADAPAPVAVKESLFQESVYIEPDYITIFEFTLHFDPEFTSRGEYLELKQELILDGQSFSAESAEIYPTHMRLNITETESSTVWLKSMELYLMNEKGERFEAVSNGIRSTGSPESPMMNTYWLESSYFSQSESLTLYITDVTWLDKDMEKIKVDLATGTAESLPEGVKLEQALLTENGWLLTFSAPYIKENHLYQLFANKYYDSDDNEYEYMSWSSGDSEITGESLFTVRFALSNYYKDTVYLTPAYSRRVTLDTPAEVKIK